MEVKDFLAESDWNAAVRVDVHSNSNQIIARPQFHEIQQQAIDYYEVLRATNDLSREQARAIFQSLRDNDNALTEKWQAEMLSIAEMFYTLMRGKLAEFAAEKQQKYLQLLNGSKSS